MADDREPNEGQGAAAFGLTRRRLLYGLTATSVGGSAGVGATGMFSDSETVASTTGTGIVDLEAAWEESERTVTGEGDEGTETARFWLPHRGGVNNHRGGVNNPAYVWVRTQCPGGDFEDDLSVEVVLETNEDTYELADGTLGEIRAEFGGGRFLHALDGDDPGALQPRSSDERGDEGTWALRFEWEGDGVVGTGSVAFNVTFHAVQARNLTVAEAETTYDPGWEACDDDEEDDDGGDDDEGFSYVAFGANETLTEGDFAVLERNGFTLEYELAESAPDVEEIAIKQSTTLYVFTDPDPDGDTVEMTDADVEYGKGQGNRFTGPGPQRTVPHPIPRYCGVLKYEPEEGNYQTVKRCQNE
jgi:hypothetical protein